MDLETLLSELDEALFDDPFGVANLRTQEELVLHHLVGRWFQDRRPTWYHKQANFAVIGTDNMVLDFDDQKEPVAWYREGLDRLHAKDLLNENDWTETKRNAWASVAFAPQVWKVMDRYAKRGPLPGYVMPGHPDRRNIAWRFGNQTSSTTKVVGECRQPAAVDRPSSTSQRAGKDQPAKAYKNGQFFIEL